MIERRQLAPEREYLKNILLTLGIATALGLWRYGIRWEESLEHAQIFSGAISYPTGHPLDVYARSAPSIQTWISSLILVFTGSAAVVEAFRNGLLFFLTLFAATSLERSLRGQGLFVLVFVMLGVHLEFDGSYPAYVWPGAYTNGPIGMAYMLIALAALTSKRWNIAALLIALSPAVHLGLAPPLLLTAAIALVYSVSVGFPPSNKRLILAASVGTFATVVVFAAAAMLAPGVSESGVYHTNVDGGETWRAYTFNFDTHRKPPPVNSYIGAYLALIISGLSVYFARRSNRDIHWSFAIPFVFVCSTMAIVTIARCIHIVLGESTPFLVIGWMPYRLLNLLPIVAMAAAIGAANATWSRGVFVTSSIFFACMILVLGVVHHVSGGSEFVHRYLAHGEFAYFCLCGFILGLFAHAVGPTKAMRWIRLSLAIVVALSIAPWHQFGAVCLVIGTLIGVVAGLARMGAVERYPEVVPTKPDLLIEISCGLIVTTVFLVTFVFPPAPRPHLERGEFEAAVREELAEVDPGAMIAAGPEAFMFQAQTGHPVFVDATTKSLMSYMPELGPVINKMYTEVYGMPIERGAYNPNRWLDVWEARSRDEWAALAPWGFEYVAAPDSIDLDLDPVLEAGGQRLYKMP